MIYHTVLFDLDGTLLDTYDGIAASLREMERRLGIKPLPEKSLGRFIGPPFVQALGREYCVTPKRARVMAAVFREIYRGEGVLRTTLYPGVEGLLEALGQQGKRLGIASMKSEEMANVCLQRLGIGGHFSYVACNRGGTPTKAELIREALDSLSHQSGEFAILVGDTDYDEAGAREVGIDFAAQLYGYGFASGHSPQPGPMCVCRAVTPEQLYNFLITH